MGQCHSLEEVRTQIDRIDQHIVRLIAERAAYVTEAAAFKRDEQAVRAPARVEQVVAKVRALAEEEGVDASLVEAVYRTLIEQFIASELRTHAKLAITQKGA